MQKRQSETKTETKNTLSPYQAEKAEAQAVPVSRPARAGEALLRLQRRVGNRAVQRLLVQRQEPEEEEEIQLKRLAQRRGGGEAFTLDDETAGRINRARGGGQPLADAVQIQMSATLGHDFSGVRVHTDSEADALNQQLSARAFTTGQDIFFKRGTYDPACRSGRELIAHELSHVVQQGTGWVPGEGGNGLTVRPAGDAWEHEADANARAGAGYDPVAPCWSRTRDVGKVGWAWTSPEARGQIQRFCGRLVEHNAQTMVMMGPDVGGAGGREQAGIAQSMGRFRLREAVYGPLWSQGAVMCVGVLVWKDSDTYALAHLAARDGEETPADMLEHRLRIVEEMLAVTGGKVVAISSSDTSSRNDLWQSLVRNYGPLQQVRSEDFAVDEEHGQLVGKGGQVGS